MSERDQTPPHVLANALCGKVHTDGRLIAATPIQAAGAKPYWQSPNGTVALYLGDARNVLPSLPQGRDGVDLLLTDPPYGVAAKATGHRQHKLALDKIANDETPETGREIAAEVLPLAWRCLRFMRHAYVFGPFDLTTLSHAAGVCDLVWDKVTPTMGDLDHPWGRQHEPIQFAMRADGKENAQMGGKLARVRRGSVLRHHRPNGSGAKHHISEKPVQLLRELIEMSSRHGETVLDPFAGSGSTLVAAVIEGRHAIGIELEESICEVAAKRLDAITRQASLFGAA